jgi:cell volume regulation protein A
MRQIPLAATGHYPIRVLAAAGLIYGAASVAHGSGFLAVFVTGLLIGDARAPYKLEIERFHTSLASLAEIAVFIALGLTIDLGSLAEDALWLDGLALAALLIFVARPLAVAPLLAPVRLRLREKLFVAWGGLRGAVPILLAAFAVLGGVDDSQRIYDIVFIVVALSVVVQGSSIPFVAAKLRIPMRLIEHEPLDALAPVTGGMPNLRRYTVTPRARAAGRRISDLPLGENAWITTVIRDGEVEHPGGPYVLEPGDRLLVIAPEETAAALGRLFEGD